MTDRKAALKALGDTRRCVEVLRRRIKWSWANKEYCRDDAGRAQVDAEDKLLSALAAAIEGGDALAAPTDADPVARMKSDPSWYERVAALNAEVSVLKTKLAERPPDAEREEYQWPGSGWTGTHHDGYFDLDTQKWVDRKIITVREGAAPPAAVPQGWKLVPVEPTPAIHDAIVKSMTRFTEWRGGTGDIYAAILFAAAPSPTGGEGT